MERWDNTGEPALGGSERPETIPAKDQVGSVAAAAARERPIEVIEPRIPVAAATTPGDSGAVFKITRPGSYYLIADVVGEEGKTGIEISASRVVLDLMGYAVVGVTGSKDGILVNVEAKGVAVRGGIVRDWGAHGLNLASASDGCFRGIVASGNKLNGLLAGARSGFVDCSAQGNIESGIQAGDGSTVRACAAQDNASGILLGRDCIVSDCLVRGNYVFGIFTGEGSNVHGCTAIANQISGIQTKDGSIVSECTASFNTNVGIYPGGGSTVSNCTMSENGTDGIRPGEGTAVGGCTMRGNGASGIQITSRNRVAGNVCDNNGAAGIRVTGSDNRIEGNSVTGNDRGLEIRAAANTVSGNMVRSNRDNYDIVAGNHLNILLSQIPESIDWPASILLAGSLTGVSGSNGITVNSSDVAIDLAGHALIGVPGSLDAIEVIRESLSLRTNISVRNGTVRGWGDAGVNAGYADNGHFRDLHLLSNGNSTLEPGLHCGSNSVITGCTAKGNGGNGIQAGLNCVIRDCTAQDNGADGINAATGAIHGCTAYSNEDDGISGGTGSTIRECVARKNGGDGIVVSSHCYVINNNSGDNEGAGIRLKAGSQFNRIESNHVSDNIVGIAVESPINLIIRNSASHNGDLDPVTGGVIVNYDIVAGNSVGDIVNGSDLDTDSNPHANYFV